MPFNPREICELTVNGKKFRDWKSITVYLCRAEPYDYYRFTVSEDTVASKVFGELRIKPGHQCTVTLGGEYAIGGFVTTRQVAYTEKAHGVEITGKSYTFKTVNGSASVPGGELRDKTYTQAATEILKPFGLTFEPKGNISQEKFPRLNVTGQSAWEVLETAARSRNIVLGPDPYSPNGFWGTSPSYTQDVGRVEEGKNILEGRETISMEFGSGNYLSLAQAAPTPQEWGPIVTSAPLGQFSSAFAERLGVGGFFMPLASMTELPGKQSDAGQRSGSENTALSREQLKVEVVLQGWFNGNRLWRPWNMVTVKSPMLNMDEALHCKSVTFTQDDRSGTRTTLELVNEIGPAGPKFGQPSGGGGG